MDVHVLKENHREEDDAQACFPPRTVTGKTVRQHVHARLAGTAFAVSIVQVHGVFTAELDIASNHFAFGVDTATMQGSLWINGMQVPGTFDTRACSTGWDSILKRRVMPLIQVMDAASRADPATRITVQPIETGNVIAIPVDDGGHLWFVIPTNTFNQVSIHTEFIDARGHGVELGRFDLYNSQSMATAIREMMNAARELENAGFSFTTEPRGRHGKALTITGKEPGKWRWTASEFHLTGHASQGGGLRLGVGGSTVRGKDVQVHAGSIAPLISTVMDMARGIMNVPWNVIAIENAPASTKLVTIATAPLHAIDGFQGFPHSDRLQWVVGSTHDNYPRGMVRVAFTGPRGMAFATLKGYGGLAVHRMISTLRNVSRIVGPRTGEQILSMLATNHGAIQQGLKGSYGVLGTVSGVHVYAAIGHGRGSSNAHCWIVAPDHGQPAPTTARLLLRFNDIDAILQHATATVGGLAGQRLVGEWIKAITSPPPAGLGYHVEQFMSAGQAKMRYRDTRGTVHPLVFRETGHSPAARREGKERPRRGTTSGFRGK